MKRALIFLACIVWAAATAYLCGAFVTADLYWLRDIMIWTPFARLCILWTVGIIIAVGCMTAAAFV